MNHSARLPEYHYTSPETAAIQEALTRQTDKMEAARDDLFAQLHIPTATWGLSLWETALGLEVDATRPYAFRRSRVMSKLRGQGVTTTEMIKNVAESFIDGQVDIVEYPNEYRFDVNLVGQFGIPPNLGDLTAAIDEIKPAHLLYRYIRRYLLIRDIHEVMTLSEVESCTLDKFAGREAYGN